MKYHGTSFCKSYLQFKINAKHLPGKKSKLKQKIILCPCFNNCFSMNIDSKVPQIDKKEEKVLDAIKVL